MKSSAQRRPKGRRKKASARKLPFDKYDLYKKAVQSPEGDAVFLRKVYRDLRKKNPRVLREDFCGTGVLCMEWVKLDAKNEGFGVDLDPEPMEYGRANDLPKLKSEQQSRMHFLRMNVLDPKLPKADISVGLNFSYFLFKKREQLKAYFKNVHSHLKPAGIAVFDAFGGSQCQGQIEDRTRHKGFTYFWDQTGFDPVSSEGVFHIHFKVGAKKYKKIFTYDWRMWTLPELREILAEVGFKKTHIYWEGTARDGSGSGNFHRVEKGEECLSWIAYVVAEK